MSCCGGDNNSCCSSETKNQAVVKQKIISKVFGSWEWLSVIGVLVVIAVLWK